MNKINDVKLRFMCQPDHALNFKNGLYFSKTYISAAGWFDDLIWFDISNSDYIRDKIRDCVKLSQVIFDLLIN